jgi:hypothetical protein
VDYDETAVSSDAETALVTLSPDIKAEVTINVDESNILSLELGQSATVTIASIGDDVFGGSVTEINKTASSASGVTRYSAVVTLDKTPEMLQGMTAKVVIRIEGVENAVIIPVEALHQTSSRSFVYTSYDEELKEFGGLTEVTVATLSGTRRRKPTPSRTWACPAEAAASPAEKGLTCPAAASPAAEAAELPVPAAVSVPAADFRAEAASPAEPEVSI